MAGRLEDQCLVLAEPGAYVGVDADVGADVDADVGVAADLVVEHRLGWESAALLLAARGQVGSLAAVPGREEPNEGGGY